MVDAPDLLTEVAGISERELRQVLALVDGTEIEELEVGLPGGHLRLRRRIPQDSDPAVLAATSHTEPEPDDDALAVASPLVGVFHPLVAAGDTVQSGQRLGRIEAMGMPTNVEAPRAGRVLQILAPDGTGVEYGQPLLSLRPDDGFAD